MEVTSRFDFSSVVIEREQAVMLMVRVKAPPSPQETKRKPLNLALVLDRSGSMGGDKIAYLNVAASELVNHLMPRDRLSIVIFDDEVETVIPPQPVTDKARIKSAIQRIYARDCTNFSGGWLEGLMQVEAGLAVDAINRVLLLSDGLANRGVTEHDRLRAIACRGVDPFRSRELAQCSANYDLQRKNVSGQVTAELRHGVHPQLGGQPPYRPHAVQGRERPAQARGGAAHRGDPIKDARVKRFDPQKRPHYGPTERPAILEARAARAWSVQRTAEAFLATAATIAYWIKRVDEEGPDALVQIRNRICLCMMGGPGGSGIPSAGVRHCLKAKPQSTRPSLP